MQCAKEAICKVRCCHWEGHRRCAAAYCGDHKFCNRHRWSRGSACVWPAIGCSFLEPIFAVHKKLSWLLLYSISQSILSDIHKRERKYTIFEANGLSNFHALLVIQLLNFITERQHAFQKCFDCQCCSHQHRDFVAKSFYHSGSNLNFKDHAQILDSYKSSFATSMYKCIKS